MTSVASEQNADARAKNDIRLYTLFWCDLFSWSYTETAETKPLPTPFCDWPAGHPVAGGGAVCEALGRGTQAIGTSNGVDSQQIQSQVEAFKART